MSDPDLWLHEPPRSGADPAAFDDLLDRALAAGSAHPIDYELDAPRWEFLQHAIDRGGILLHGSNDPEIRVLETRPADDVRGFGAQTAVYAASDAIWAMYFAIVDRSRPVSLLNGCSHRLGETTEPLWFFSVSQSALDRGAWRDGTVYLLPAQTFVRDDDVIRDGVRYEQQQLASLTSVRPLAKLRVTPADFPFLDRVVGHDPETVRARAIADPDAFPWL